MKSKMRGVWLFVWLQQALFTAGFATNVYDLRCEHLESPLGIDAIAPRLMWRLPPGVRVQEAYRLIVGTDSAQVANGEGDHWNTGKVLSSDIRVNYAGRELQPFTRYYWKVTAWDDKNTPVASDIAFFETGLMDMHRWRGAWITDSHDIHLKPAGYFRKAFTTGRKIRQARAYIAVAGLYELYLNGKRVGDHRLDPAYTRFDRRTLYLTHDITSLLRQGDNAVGVLLGNGWYNHQSTAVWFFDQAPWRGRPKFCMDIRIVYDDGTMEYVSTGQDWKTSKGPLVFNSIYTAEHYDARLEQAGWNQPGFDDSKWGQAGGTFAPAPLIVSQQMQPIRDVETLLPVKMTRLSDTAYLFDLGRNISGVSELKVTGKPGTEIRLKHAERIGKDGRVDMTNIELHYRPTDDSDPFQTDRFILSGKGEESFRARFNYKGFQYIEVISSEPVDLTANSLKAYFMHSDVPPVGSITSSSELLNKIWAATNSSYLANLFGYPTDCPQREKNGWTGDAQIAIETGLYNFDGITVYEKWLADHQDEQAPNGVLPAIIPTCGWGYHWANGTDWTSTIAIIPWNIYRFYGDFRLLASVYDNMKRYVDYINRTYPSGITDWGLGDWIPIQSVSNKELTSSAYYYVVTDILAKSAKLLGKQADHATYSALAEYIKKTLNARFLNEQTGIYGSGLQTEQSIPLCFRIVPDPLRQTVADNLARRVREDGGMDVGLLGSKALLNALSENGYADLAYSLASNDAYPSWGWWIKNGATTLYENWRIGGTDDISMNHIMFGEIGAWYYKALGGLFPDEASPGFKHFLLKPNFVKGLEHFEATHISPYGEIVSSWKRNGKKISYKVTVPPNSSATFYVGEAYRLQSESSKNKAGNGCSVELTSGTWHFDLKEK